MAQQQKMLEKTKNEEKAREIAEKSFKYGKEAEEERKKVIKAINDFFL
jgi:hypothetical protein